MGDESPKPASTPTGAVFLSYASQNAEAAQRICDALRSAGLEVWFDQSALRGGDAWDRQIRERIHDCRLFIALISAHTEARDEGYFRREWKLAVDRTYDMLENKTFLLPVVIDGTPERGAAVPDKFHEVQWTRLPAGQTPLKFVTRIQQLLSGESPQSTTPARGPMAAISARSSRLSRASFSPSPHSIAVLPFSNITGSPDMDYLGDGMSEELIHKLTRVPGFRVPARTSSFAYKGRKANVRDIARDLNVALVIEGSVRTAGEHIRVTAQVIDARSGYHVWSQTYDRQLADIFALQDELASAVVNALQGDGSSLALREIISATPTHDIEAYQLYLQGSALYSQPSVTNVRKAIELCNQAIRRDPSFSRAMCTVALAHILAAGNGWEPLPSALANAEQNADRALAIDAALADARGVLGVVHACRRQWLEAEDHFRSALSVTEINPITAQTHSIVLLASVGHLRDAMREAEGAYRLAPALAHVLMVHATLHSLAGNDAEALRYTDFAAAHGWPINVRPFPHIHSVAAVRAGRYSEAVQWTMEALSAYGHPAELEPLVTSVFRAFAQPAVQNGALAAMGKFFAERSAEVVRTTSLPRFLMHWSVLFANLDFAYLVGNRALDHFDAEGAMAVTAFVPHLWIPEFRAFRQDARFRALATRLGLPPYWQRYGPPDAHDIPE